MYVLLRLVKKLNLSVVYFCLRWSPIITIHAISHVTQIWYNTTKSFTQCITHIRPPV
ncbi:hypothetical protein Mapa_010381 [Marchantia paleacea]|nr:hypothetical protein Mapa_010381 [Marchantia paleacea]